MATNYMEEISYSKIGTTLRSHRIEVLGVWDFGGGEDVGWWVVSMRLGFAAGEEEGRWN